MRLTRDEKETLVVKEARNGRGIFTQKDIARGEIIFEVRGVFISGDEDEDIDEETRSNAYRYDADRYISPKGTIGDFLNHSCTPNAKVVKEGKKLFIRALRTLPKNKEVTIDYATITARDDSWTMKCNCGSKQCRKKIGKFKLLPQEIQERSIKRGIVPTYILEK